jgi:ATP-dependent Clp protease ATP-binding subunit ClpC
MLEDDVIRSLMERKHRLEKFHAVSYEDEAIVDAIQYSARYFSSDALFEKALEILDVAGTRVKLRQTKLPEEVVEVRKRVKFIVYRMENAIANHEFEKARFYTEEERKERENLRALREKYHLDEYRAAIVGSSDIADVVTRDPALLEANPLAGS